MNLTEFTSNQLPKPNKLGFWIFFWEFCVLDLGLGLNPKPLFLGVPLSGVSSTAVK